MTTSAEIKAEIDRLSGCLKDVRQMLKNGDVVDLTGLDRNVARLCTATAGLGADEEGAVADGLRTLLGQLDDLRGRMVAERSAMAESMGGLSSRRKAVSAYGKANARRV